MLQYESKKQNPYGMPRYLSARFDNRWKSQADYSCLTGDAQIAQVWLRLYQNNGDARFLNAAMKLIDQLKLTQSLDSANPDIRGGIAGSYPIWGGYKPFAYPNWPAKFFADAVMLQEDLLSNLKA